MIEPEVVWHMLCPGTQPSPGPEERRYDIPNDDGWPAGLCRLVQSLDDAAGRQRRYVCDGCHAEITVNFPPAGKDVDTLKRRERAEAWAYLVSHHGWMSHDGGLTFEKHGRVLGLRDAIAVVCAEAEATMRELRDVEAVLREQVNDGSLGDSLARKVVAQLEIMRGSYAACQKTFDRLYTDAMIGHRWFEAWFGDELKGRDFSVKCEIATTRMQQAEARAEHMKNNCELHAHLPGIEERTACAVCLTEERERAERELAVVRRVLNTDLQIASARVLTLELENQQLTRRLADADRALLHAAARLESELDTPRDIWADHIREALRVLKCSACGTAAYQPNERCADHPRPEP